MKKRVLIAALLLAGTLVAALCLATSYVALSYAATTLPKLFVGSSTTAPASPPPPLAAMTSATTTAVPAAADLPSEEPDESLGERAMRKAMEADPDIAAIVDDRDPKVSAAMRAFFEDDPKP